MSNANKNRNTANLSTAIRDGDQAAFVSCYEEQVLGVVGTAQKITRDRDEAWDIAQDTFVKLWQQREQIDPGKSLGALLRTMAVNAALNSIKRKQTTARYYREQTLLQNGADHSADTKILSREFQQKVDLIISRMPLRQREAFLLSREEGLSYNEIAQKMDISPLTVRTHISTALHEIKSLLSALAMALILP